MLLSEFIRSSVESLKTLYPEGEASAIVARLCGDRLGVKSYTHITEPATQVPQAMLPLLESDVSRLLKSEPLQYVLGFEWFCGRKFRVNRSVLIPRPETEAIVRETVDFLSDGDGAGVLDLCTGSGCIAWSVAAECPSAKVTGVDISDNALSLALSQRIDCRRSPDFVMADVLSGPPAQFVTEYDVIVSNPPYVRPSEKAAMRANVLDYEPSIALFVPEDNPLVFYDSVAVWCKRLLKKGGMGMVEINESFSAETAHLFESYGFAEIFVKDDFRGRPRFVIFRNR